MQNLKMFKFSISNSNLDINLVQSIVTLFFEDLKTYDSKHFYSQIYVSNKKYGIETPITLRQYHSITDIDYKELVNTIIDSYLNIERCLESNFIVDELIIYYESENSEYPFPFSQFITTEP